MQSVALPGSTGKKTIEGKTFVDFTSFDYLGLAKSDLLKRALHEEITAGELLTGSTRSGSGLRREQLSCESRLAKFIGAEKCLTFASRTQAWFSLIAATATQNDLLFIDDHLDIPIADLAALCGITTIGFNGDDLESLLRLLPRQAETKSFIAIESLSPVTGKIRELATLNEQCIKSGTKLLVDETIALSALGERGSGIIELQKIPHAVTAIITSLNYSLVGSFTALLSGVDIYARLLTGSRALANEPTLPPFLYTLAEAGIDFVELALSKRIALSKNIALLRSGLKFSDISSQLLPGTASPIISIKAASKTTAERLKFELFKHGFLVDCIDGSARDISATYLRLIVSTEHQEADIKALSELIAIITARLP